MSASIYRALVAYEDRWGDRLVFESAGADKPVFLKIQFQGDDGHPGIEMTAEDWRNFVTKVEEGLKREGHE